VNGGQAQKLAKIGVVRKSIARVLTVFNQITREKLKQKYVEMGNGLPKEFREKKTRAIRRRLTKEQLAKKTVKTAKKSSNFPKRKYALKA
jgi:large subunit ribosomal protein L35e